MIYLIKRILFRLKHDNFKTIIGLIINFFNFKNKKINLDKIDVDESFTLDEIFLMFGTDKGKLDGKKTFYKIYKNLDTRHKFKNYKEWILRKNMYDFEYELGLDYTSIYESIFKPIRYQNLKILEIGVAGGHSHASWYKYFPNSEIYGIDIRPEKNLLYCGKRLKYFQVDCVNLQEVDNFIKNQTQFDIIIDDSLHDYEGFIGNLINFFPILKPKGLYFLEDFKRKDVKLLNMRNYNEKFGKKLQGYSLTMDEIFKNLNNKIFFDNDYFGKKYQEYLHLNIKKIELFYPEHPSAAIAFIKKN